ncbi:DUF2752 domain-containing protein [Nocardioides malaquae]|uniref:DUF2752 domain-containing protein n=1 Tax=Nocardioides malaquae TaxID=2773426 RepID=UPI0029D41CBC|nr:DUF2752 domain-containing protein [Nocardioides malaquae]
MTGVAETLTSSPTTWVGRVAPVLGAGAGVALATLALHLRDPHVQGSWGFCPSALLGVACPFCGSLRAVHHLTDLDLAAAASSNVVLVAAAPVAGVLWLVALWRAARGGVPLLPSPSAAVWWTVAAALVVFTVLRNIPWAPVAWLAP